ncbi:Rieske (2Fe-2S) protein [Micromonospora sp. NPDC048935]|uniref:Rieske (2Fe-2S) protein n=1 Tax=Micromonospora sp. NPDC048935 TaxID=3364262 RepID=UPI003710A7D0
MTPMAEVLRNLAGLPWLEPGERSRAADRAHQLQAADWTRLAASGQIGRTPVARQAVHLGESRTLLLWRTRSRHPVAMDALCPHKPFSMVGARLVGDALECPVHRRRFGRTACVSTARTANRPSC